MDDEQRNTALDQQLQDSYRVEPPPALKQRLLSIPNEVAQSAGAEDSRTGVLNWWHGSLRSIQWQLAIPAMSVLAAVIVLWTAGIRIADDAAPPEADPATLIAQEQALRDFITVMNYLHLSTARAQAAVHEELGAGLRTAFERGEQSFRDTSNEITNGG